MTNPNGGPVYGRDRRRRLSVTEARELYERANGFCQKCGVLLGADWHQAHLTSHYHGGGTFIGNMEAWCLPCNLKLGATDAASFGEITSREWQENGLPAVLTRLYEKGFATLWAGMGSGKTIFSAFLLRALMDASYIERLLFVVPNLNLVNQVVDEYRRLNIHLDNKPRDGVIEHPDTVGAVVTYHSLPRAARMHVTRMGQVPTLVIFDEVHHLSDKASWGRAATSMVGNIANGSIEHAVCVLNMTGTLFRSDKKARISTVDYIDDGEKIQAVADHEVPMADLIGVELRAPDVYVYGTDVRLLDLDKGEVIEGSIADLDDQQRSAGIRGAFMDKMWLRGFCTEAMTLLRRSLEAIDHREPLKLLYVAHDQRAAKRAADMLNEITRQNFARLVISDEPGALRTLKAAKQDRQSCAIVTVAMVTEGFDCSHVAVEAYASNKVADLFVAQAATRTMRVTATERADGRMLPATILIPDYPKMRNAFETFLKQFPHTLVDDEEGGGPGGDGERLPRYQLLDVNSPLLNSTNVLTQEDGELLAHEFEHYLAECENVGIPGIYAPRVGVVGRRNNPLPRIYDPEPTASVTVTDANPREINVAHRGRITQVSGWMAKHIDHDGRFADVGEFQWQANDAAEIPTGGRDHASTDQLTQCFGWMVERVQEHCRDHGERTPDWAKPEWARGDDQ